MQEKKAHQKGTTTIIYIRVKPGSRTSEIGAFENGLLHVRAKSAPVKGKANEEVIELLAEFFDKAKSEIEIDSGATSSIKKVIIYNASLDDILKKISK